MYSIVLAAMLTTGTTPAGGLFHHGCHGCHGCHGAWGCYGGCYSCYGCLGCYGCYGGYGSWGCTGCYACYGSGWGGYGCWGSCYGGWGGYGCYGGCYGCYGSCYGGWGCYGGGYGGYMESGVPAAPTSPAMPGAPTSKEPIKAPNPNPPKTGTGSLPARAQILVQLPTDAKLFVDDHPITLPANQKTVVTPELEPGQDYYYIFRAEAVRNGTPVTENRRVIVRAGARLTVDFGDLATAKAKESADRVTVQK